MKVCESKTRARTSWSMWSQKAWTCFDERVALSSRTGFVPKTAPATTASASPAGRAGGTAESLAKACKPSPSLEGVKGFTVVLPVTPRLMIGVSLTPPLLDEAYIGSV